MNKLIISLILLLPIACQADIGFHNISPISLNMTEGQWVFKFIDHEQKKSGYTVKLFIRYNPKCIAKGEPGNGSHEDFLKALMLLKQKVSSKKDFIFGFKGNPIKGKVGHYQAENLKILKQKFFSIVWSVNSSHSHYECVL